MYKKKTVHDFTSGRTFSESEGIRTPDPYPVKVML